MGNWRNFVKFLIKIIFHVVFSLEIFFHEFPGNNDGKEEEEEKKDSEDDNKNIALFLHVSCTSKSFHLITF